MANLNRRSFFGAIAALTTIHYTITKFDYGSRTPASTYLLNAWRNHHKGKQAGYMANTLLVSQELFDKYESELMAFQRFCADDPADEDGRSLKFKCCTMRASDKLTGWDYIFI